MSIRDLFYRSGASFWVCALAGFFVLLGRCLGAVPFRSSADRVWALYIAMVPLLGLSVVFREVVCFRCWTEGLKQRWPALPCLLGLGLVAVFALSEWKFLGPLSFRIDWVVGGGIYILTVLSLGLWKKRPTGASLAWLGLFRGWRETHFCCNRDASAATSLKFIKILNGPLQDRLRAFLNLVSSRSTHRDFATKVVSRAPLFIFSVWAWRAASKLMYWGDFSNWLVASSGNPLFLAAIIAVLGASFWKNGEPARNGGSRGLWFTGAALVFSFFAFRKDYFLNAGSLSHWGVILMPAELLRHGGWLYWDVPSQYGFLNTLLLAFVPTREPLDALFWLNGGMLVTVSMISFWFFTLNWRRPMAGAVGIGVVLAAQLLVPGWVQELRGVQGYPSVGPYRFFWCYAFLLVVIVRAAGRGAVSVWVARYFRSIGWTVWLVSSLWSSESLVYGTAIWFPTLAHHLWSESPPGCSFQGVAKTITRYTAGHLASLAFVVLLIGAYYRLVLGHFPDALGFFDYSFAFAGGFGRVSVERFGPIQLLWIAWLVMTVAMLSGPLREAPTHQVTAWFCLWVSSSYYVSRSHDNNILNLLPLHLACVHAFFVPSVSFSERHADSIVSAMKHAFLVSCYTVVVLLTYCVMDFKGAVSNIVRSYRTPLTALIRDNPLESGAVEPLIHKAGNVPGDLWVHVSPGSKHHIYSSPWPAQGLWNPFPSTTLFNPLRPDRARRYFERFAEKADAQYGGRRRWFFYHADSAEEIKTVLTLLGQRYVFEPPIQQGAWTLIQVSSKRAPDLSPARNSVHTN